VDHWQHKHKPFGSFAEISIQQKSSPPNGQILIQNFHSNILHFHSNILGRLLAIIRSVVLDMQ